MALKAHEHPLKKVFSSDFDFKIPNYQRPYAWGVEQARQLLDDLEGAVTRGGKDEYFLGSLVLIQKDPAAPQVDVVDGQQRLTTLTILLAILRDLATAKNGETLGAMVMEPGVDLDGIPPRPRLQLRQQDADFFKSFVQEAGKIDDLLATADHGVETDSQAAIRDNAIALNAHLADWDQEKRDRLASYIRNETFLVVVTTPSIESAHRIFSVMNDRGLDLAPTDIFKADVIGTIVEHDRDTYAKRWEDAEEALGRDDFGDLFLHIRTLVARTRGVRTILEEFPDQVLAPYLARNASAEFIDDFLAPYAEAYGHIVKQDLEGSLQWSQVNDYLSILKRLDNNDWRPPALWALRHHKHDPEFLVEFFRRLERFAAISLLRREYSTPRQTRYLELLKQLNDGKGLEAPALTPSHGDKKDARDRLNGELYGIRTVDRYVLLRLDGILAAGSGVSYEHKILSVEHVLPQNPKEAGEWTDVWPVEDVRAYWTHRLGNLLLLNRRKNGEAGRREFGHKKETYFKSPQGTANFALTTQVLSHDAWTPEVVRKRHEELTQRLFDLWELN